MPRTASVSEHAARNAGDFAAWIAPGAPRRAIARMDAIQAQLLWNRSGKILCGRLNVGFMHRH